MSQNSREAIQNTFEFHDDYDEWQHYEDEKFAFVTIVTHECRSAIDNTLIAPFIRYNDNRMSIMGVTALNRWRLIQFLIKVSNGKHLNLKTFNAKFATEWVIVPETDCCYNIDGEIYDNDEAHIKMLPGFLNLMGRLYEMKEEHRAYADRMENQ